MKKLIVSLIAAGMSVQALASSFPTWNDNPQDGLEAGLIAGVSCVESMGDMSLDKDIALMEARAELAASFEAMVKKELDVNRSYEKKKIVMADRNEKIENTTLTAKSSTKQVANQLMKFTWVANAESVIKDSGDYYCARVVAKMPTFVSE